MKTALAQAEIPEYFRIRPHLPTWLVISAERIAKRDSLEIINLADYPSWASHTWQLLVRSDYDLGILTLSKGDFNKEDTVLFDMIQWRI